MNTLEEICAKKRLHVEDCKAKTTLADLKARIENQEKPRGFLNALKSSSGPALIAEVKKASPSKGVIRADFDPVSIAKIYEENGAACLSVLTDSPYFQGHDDYLVAIKKAVRLPLLRKDFMIDEYQIYEARALGADCILIIMAALDDQTVKTLYDLSVSLGMDVLMEVHDLPELERAKTINPMMIGVNNRNLKTLAVDIQTSFNLAPHYPANTFKIAESGIGDHTTILSLRTAGYKGFLVGESLMRQDDIAKATLTLLGQ